MDEKHRKQMAKMVDAVQPHCDEPIAAAMTCSLAGSMASVLISRILGGSGGSVESVALPNPVFIAVGPKSIYAFEYAPKGFGFKIKREVVRWPRDEVRVETKNPGGMASFTLTTSSGETASFEIPTLMGGRQLVDAFFEALGGSQDS